MNRLLLAVIAALATAFIAGCPVYSNDQSFPVCNSQGCFDCPDRSYSSACVPSPCEDRFDCPSGFICNYGGQCVSTPSSAGTCSAPSDCGAGATCGADNVCHPGDCGSGVGCPGGYACTLVAGVAQCLSSGSDAAVLDANVSDAVMLDTSAAAVESGPPAASDAAADAPSEAGSTDGAACIDGSCQ
jgi:hypothetical protein